VIGAHAQRWHGVPGAGSVGDAARRWLECPGPVIPLAHPSPRNNAWLSRHPWFEKALIPQLREQIVQALHPCD
ncbi:MAG: uracil-DNA glycosylase family protein, partial [Wenzhouxiangellaceae bacterium]